MHVVQGHQMPDGHLSSTVLDQFYRLHKERVYGINWATPTLAFLGFRLDPSGVAKAQGIGPSGCAITSLISSFRLSAASII